MVNKLKNLNSFLREQSLNLYRDCLKKHNFKVVLHQPPNGAYKYIFESWRIALNFMGVDTRILPVVNPELNPKKYFKKNSYIDTIFISIGHPYYEDSILYDYLIEQENVLIGKFIDIHERTNGCEDFYLTTHFTKDYFNQKKFDWVDTEKLFCVPCGANPVIHRMDLGRFKDSTLAYSGCVLIGTNSARKQKEFRKFIMPVAVKHPVCFVGNGWGEKSKEISVKSQAAYYSDFAISLNYHREVQYEENFTEVNDRTFAIIASGGFLITDSPFYMKHLFKDDEVVRVITPKEYFDVVDFFLKHPKERQAYMLRGMNKVYKEYTLFKFLDTFLKDITKCF